MLLTCLPHIKHIQLLLKNRKKPDKPNFTQFQENLQIKVHLKTISI